MGRPSARLAPRQINSFTFPIAAEDFTTEEADKMAQRCVAKVNEFKGRGTSA